MNNNPVNSNDTLAISNKLEYKPAANCSCYCKISSSLGHFQSTNNIQMHRLLYKEKKIRKQNLRIIKNIKT